MEQPFVAARALSRSYGRRPAVRDLDLTIARGEILACLGPNGAGKTTLISMLTGLLRPDSGEILYDGQPFGPGSHTLKRRIGVVPQHNNLDRDLSVEANLNIHGLLFGMRGKELAGRIDAVLAIADLAGQKKRLCAELSGGMQRRTIIARALLHEPEILFLDEPSAGLDPVARRKTHGLLQELNGAGATIFLTTHYIEEAQALASRVAFMHGGKLAACGTPDALKGDVLLEDAYFALAGEHMEQTEETAACGAGG
jgi:ABC-2 type transport system ATP-binding protein